LVWLLLDGKQGSFGELLDNSVVGGFGRGIHILKQLQSLRSAAVSFCIAPGISGRRRLSWQSYQQLKYLADSVTRFYAVAAVDDKQQ
jgi:hypothetical protein